MCMSLSVCLHCIRPGTHSSGNPWGIANRILYSPTGNSSNSGILFQSNACSTHLPGTCCNQTCDMSGHSQCDDTTIIQPIGTRGQKWDSAESPNQYTLIDNVMIAAAITAAMFTPQRRPSNTGVGGGGRASSTHGKPALTDFRSSRSEAHTIFFIAGISNLTARIHGQKDSTH